METSANPSEPVDHPLVGIIAGVLVAGLGLGTWLYAGGFPSLPEGYPGPSLFPRLIAASLLGAGLVIAIQAAVRMRRASTHRMRIDRRGLLRLLLGLAIVALYPVLHGFLGFIPTLTLVCLGLGLLLKTRPLVAIVASLGAAVLIFVLFTYVLGVPL